MLYKRVEKNESNISKRIKKDKRNAHRHSENGMTVHGEARRAPLRFPLKEKERIAALTNKARKGTWRMPWLREAMKDVISCDKLR